ncbi:MAG: hypothetical protein JO212_13335, partial [Acetobacteraceae bacterium]|nr:hypothetical protein [Acetobacteraceae bacterium]
GAGGPEIAAGNVHGLGPGSVLAVLPEPTADLQDAIGYVEVKSATAFRARLQPVAHEGKAALANEEIKSGFYARLVQPKLNLELKVARPAEVSNPTAPEQALLQALRAVASSSANRVELRWLDPDEPADVRLLIAHDRLWFLPSSSASSPADLSGNPSVEAAGSPEAISSRIAEALFKIARVHTMLEAGTALGAADQLGFEVSMSLRRAHYGDAPRPPNCAEAESEKPVPLALSVVPELRQCDVVDLQIRNVSDTPIDVTALYIDSAYGVTALYPKDADEGNRIVAGGVKRLPIEIRTLDAKGRTTTAGIERVLFIAVKVRPGSQMVSFRFLEQPSLPVTKSDALQKRGLQAASLIELLEQAVYEPTRGPPVVLQNQIADNAISVVDLAVQPEPNESRSRRVGP